MKQPYYERLRVSQRAYHRRCKWVMKNGIYAPHAYPDPQSVAHSWWDDVGFILGDRRVMVWWIHPRQRYADELDDRAWREAEACPSMQKALYDAPEASIPHYKQLGRSRKKIVAYSRQPFTDEKRQFHDQLRAISDRLKQTGIDYHVAPSWRRERLSWGTGITLIAPLEVHNETELKAVATLAYQLLRGASTLEQAFPNYTYGKTQWLAEQSGQ